MILGISPESAFFISFSVIFLQIRQKYVRKMSGNCPKYVRFLSESCPIFALTEGFFNALKFG
nr:MAG TPA: hypothetical protein [Caudoviricetes sp.]